MSDRYIKALCAIVSASKIVKELITEYRSILADVSDNRTVIIDNYHHVMKCVQTGPDVTICERDDGGSDYVIVLHRPRIALRFTESVGGLAASAPCVWHYDAAHRTDSNGTNAEWKLTDRSPISDLVGYIERLVCIPMLI